MPYDNPLYHRLIATLREWCNTQQLQEVRTPVLSAHPPYEPHIQGLQTTLHTPPDHYQRQYLHASPECAMKKLLAEHKQDIYQITPVFRNDECSPLHLHEFTLLEWYRCRKTDTEMMQECGELLSYVLSQLSIDGFHRPHHHLSADTPIRHLSMCSAFEQSAQLDLLATIDHPLTPSPHLLRQEAQRRNVATHDDDSWEDIFYRLFLEFIEPHLGMDAITFLTDYPTPLALLARPHDDEPRLSHRFELFIVRVELANGYEELQGRAANHERLSLWNSAPDESFLHAMDDLPAVTGMALGIERLFLLLSGEPDLSCHWR